MSTAFKLKVLALGEKESKEFFFKHSRDFVYRFQSNYKLTVGVDILSAECYFNDCGDTASLSLWDIGTQERFAFIRYTFYRGAAGCLLFCNLKSLGENDNLDEYLSEVRTYSSRIPVYLVCYLPEDLLGFNLQLLDRFVEVREIIRYFIIPNQLDAVLVEFTRDVLANRSEIDVDNLNNTEIFKEKEIFFKFLRYFRTCPICNNVNHISYLRRFFYDANPISVKIKKKLLWFTENCGDPLQDHKSILKIGIPCCSCFKKYIGTN